MGDLFWNKIAGVVIGTILAIMVIGLIAEGLFPEHGEETEFAYPLDLASLGTGSTAVEEAPEIDLGTLLANASADAGERIARRCVSCHTFEQGGANGTGPNLWGVVGADKATHAGFGYSAALSSMEGTWTYENLDAFIENPRGYVPGTNMSFAGLRGEEDRADLLAYLQTLSADPVPFPAPAPAEADTTGDEAGGEMIEGEDAAVTADAESGETPVIEEQEIESQAAAAGGEDLTDEPETTEDETGDGEE
ncbi:MULTISPECIES: c-type cytochrome [Hyphobacterium]|uniref:Cytochrome c family protein n=1 Tax=Hyphobacterium vulgare TaxID=1736751 RepID=A0ABV6ZV69_9PROT